MGWKNKEVEKAWKAKWYLENRDREKARSAKWIKDHPQWARKTRCKREKTPAERAKHSEYMVARAKLKTWCPHCGNHVGMIEWHMALQLLGVTIDELERRGIQSVAEQIAKECDFRIAAASEDKPKSSKRTAAAGSRASNTKCVDGRTAAKSSSARTTKRVARKTKRK